MTSAPDGWRRTPTLSDCLLRTPTENPRSGSPLERRAKQETYIMSNTTASTGSTTPVSAEAMTKAMQEINLLPKPDQWVLVDPQGRVYRGKVEDVARVLMAEHSLLPMNAALWLLYARNHLKLNNQRQED
jgi:hypothetical protein